MNQQRNNQLPQNSFLMLQQYGSIEPNQFKTFFNTDEPWMLSQYFQDQSSEQFQQNLVAFFNNIRQIKKIQLTSYPSHIYLKAKQLNQNDFQLDNEKLQNAASILQIQLFLIELQSLYPNQPKKTNFSSQNNQQQAIIIIEQQSSSQHISYMFGLQQQRQQIQSFPLNMCFVGSNTQGQQFSFNSQFPKPNQQQQRLKSNPYFNQFNPQINQSNHQLNQPNPQFNQPNPQFNQPNPQFNQPNPQFNQPNPQFNQPNPQLNQPNPQFNQPNPQFNQPNPQFNYINPQINYINPQINYINLQLNPSIPQSPEIDVLTTESISSKITSQKILPKQLQTPKYNPNKQQKCEICYEVYELNSEHQIMLPCCNKIVHKQCNLQELASSLDLRYNLMCFFCKKPLDINFLKNNMSSAAFQKRARELVLSKYFETCFNCKAKIQVLPEQKKKICKIECNNCKKSICSKCMKIYHEEESICKEVRQEIIQLLQGQPIIVCPFCDLIQTKDDGCNHVTCDQCRNDLCSQCSVDRKPIILHGNHFHRKGCVDFRSIKGYDQMTKERIRNCELCQKNGGCHFPIDLETYKKEKGY
ncbi:unnamed protein product [Paramecium sonneborni]|uniref:RING-type domain-containing protein n=1 Tax=Paramecium sonneborni TaxID=65129 RepID=A0A8S1PZW9_9CILI|nr:unnamed protein product [Paramecium sonneborni]